jgi:hypothetical protein
MGLRGDDLLQVETQNLDQVVSVKVEHNEWDGKVRARVAFVNAAGAGAVKLKKPMEDGAKREFAAMMRAKVATVAEVAGTRHSPGESPSESLGVGQFDDIPF